MAFRMLAKHDAASRHHSVPTTVERLAQEVVVQVRDGRRHDHGHVLLDGLAARVAKHLGEVAVHALDDAQRLRLIADGDHRGLVRSCVQLHVRREEDDVLGALDVPLALLILNGIRLFQKRLGAGRPVRHLDQELRVVPEHRHRLRVERDQLPKVPIRSRHLHVDALGQLRQARDGGVGVQQLRPEAELQRARLGRVAPALRAVALGGDPGGNAQVASAARRLLVLDQALAEVHEETCVDGRVLLCRMAQVRQL
mmetsp:Transcript_29508/g.96364  ORF Transcript_29508/g.96364 Transcript_29508/m.96364 type:complete len:254 (-) Transcript_29508:2443-3204(-)